MYVKFWKLLLKKELWDEIHNDYKGNNYTDSSTNFGTQKVQRHIYTEIFNVIQLMPRPKTVCGIDDQLLLASKHQTFNLIYLPFSESPPSYFLQICL